MLTKAELSWSLLDENNQIFVIPKETHFFACPGYLVDYFLQRSWPQRLAWKCFSENSMKLLNDHNVTNNSYSDNPYFNGYNLDLFSRYINSKPSKLKAEAFENYLKSIFHSFNGNEPKDTIKFFEKSVESPKYASIIRNLYSNCYFIHVVRNPYAIVVALRKAALKKRYPKMHRIFFSPYNFYYYLFKKVIIFFIYY